VFVSCRPCSKALTPPFFASYLRQSCVCWFRFSGRFYCGMLWLYCPMLCFWFWSFAFCNCLSGHVPLDNSEPIFRDATLGDCSFFMSLLLFMVLVNRHRFCFPPLSIPQPSPCLMSMIEVPVFLQPGFPADVVSRRIPLCDVSS